LGIADQPDLNVEKATSLYDSKIKTTKDLMEAKNHDYGEAWREMRINSLTDLILQNVRVKQIEDNKGKTIVSKELMLLPRHDQLCFFAMILMNSKS
jgi:hypothetical protein